MSQTLLTNATLACIDGTAGYGLRENAALLVDAGRIAWIGSTRDCPVVNCKFSAQLRLVMSRFMTVVVSW